MLEVKRFYSKRFFICAIQEIQILIEINIHAFHLTISDGNLICAAWLKPASISNSVEICFNIVVSVGRKKKISEDTHFIRFNKMDNKTEQKQCCILCNILVVLSISLLSWLVDGKIRQSHHRNRKGDTNGQMFLHEISMATFQLWCLYNALCYSFFGHLKVNILNFKLLPQKLHWELFTIYTNIT